MEDIEELLAGLAVRFQGIECCNTPGEGRVTKERRMHGSGKDEGASLFADLYKGIAEEETKQERGSGGVHQERRDKVATITMAAIPAAVARLLCHYCCRRHLLETRVYPCCCWWWCWARWPCTALHRRLA